MTTNSVTTPLLRLSLLRRNLASATPRRRQTKVATEVIKIMIKCYTVMEKGKGREEGPPTKHVRVEEVL